MTAMKKFISIAILLLTGTLYAEPVRVSFRPARPEAGERVNVTVTVDSVPGGRVELVLPKLSGMAQWNYNMSSDGSRMSYSGGGQPRISYTFVRQLITRQPGKLEIPPFQVRVGNQTLSGQPVTLEILPPNTRKPEKTDAPQPFARLTTVPERPLRVGEKIEFRLDIFIPENWQLLGNPNITIADSGNAILLKDHRTGEVFRLLQQPYTTNVKDHEYTVFPLAFTGKSAISGDFFPQVSVALQMRELRKISANDFRDDFFDDFFGRTHFAGRPKNFTLTAKDNAGFKVIPLPPLPKGVFDLGLSGKWQLSAKVNPAVCRAGEVAELEITAVPGDSGVTVDDTTIKVPEPDFTGFRRYPAEILRKDGKILIRYALIPLNAGEKHLDFKLGCIDAVSGKWQITNFSLPLAVTPGNVGKTADVPAAPAGKSVIGTAPEKPQTENVPAIPGLHYLKSSGENAVDIPLINNNRGMIFFWLGGGIFILLADWLFRKFRSKFSPEHLTRRRELRKHISEICRELKNGDAPETVFGKHGFSDIAELSGLSAGVTAREIADQITDPELKEFFANTVNSGFAPGTEKKTITPELRTKLLKFLKKLAVFVCGFFLVTGTAAGISAYNRGDYAAAAEEFRRELRNDRLSPELLYNLGCTEFQLGNLPEARLWFTRALLLAPGDAETAANLRAVEAKLQLTSDEESSGFSTQLAALRDSLCRPDQYLAWAAAGFFLLCVLFILRGRSGNFWRWSVAAVVLFASLIALLAAFEQSVSSYSANQLILTGKNVEIRSLPVENSGSVLKKINPGGDAVMIEKRNSWLRINADGTEGWVRDDQATQVFPYGIL